MRRFSEARMSAGNENARRSTPDIVCVWITFLSQNSPFARKATRYRKGVFSFKGNSHGSSNRWEGGSGAAAAVAAGARAGGSRRLRLRFCERAPSGCEVRAAPDTCVASLSDFRERDLQLTPENALQQCAGVRLWLVGTHAAMDRAQPC